MFQFQCPRHVWLTRLVCGMVVLIGVAAPASPWRSSLGGSAVEESLAMESRAGLRRGLNFLLAQQLPDGSWARHPALTGLAVLALLNAPGDLRTSESATAAERAAGWLRRRLAEEAVVPPGSELSPRPVLQLAVGSWALIRLGQQADRPLLGEVRTRILAAQCLDVPLNNSDHGGFRPHPGAIPDFMTTAYALETLQLLEAAGLNAGPAPGLAVIRPEVISSAADWLWRRVPEEPGAMATADRVLEQKELTGLQAAAVFKSLFYAGVTADNSRVGILYAWFGRKTSFAENPGAGDAGYYTYIFTLAQALRGCERQGMFMDDAAGKTGARKASMKNCGDWRRKMLEALLERQAGDGGWHQSVPDWWETRPELTTAYGVLAMELAL